MAGQKRTRSGQVKQQDEAHQPLADVTMTDASPPCGQPLPSSKASETADTPGDKPVLVAESEPKSTEPTGPLPSNPHPTTRKSKAKSKNRQKLARLPENATVSKRPLLHPALPTPFASSASPKVLYMTATTPYIPCLKRVRKLLTEITKREKQSAVSKTSRGQRGQRRGYAEPNGRLEAKDVEREIAEGARAKSGTAGKGGEEVYLKATGRAIPRALEIGVYFQGEDDCRVKVEMGNVSAIDDIEVRGGTDGVENEEEIPETRIRTLSSVTVSIGLK